MRVWCKSIEIPGLGTESTFLKKKTWASNSGRSITGYSSGRVAYWKYTLSLKCPMITSSDYKKLKNIFETEPQYFQVKVIDDIGDTYNFTGYSGDLTYSSVIQTDSGKYFQGVAVEVVEQ